MTVLLTLTTAGGDTGPFNLYSNVDGYTLPFETSVAKAALLLGYASSLVPDAATTVRIQSVNALCTNYVDLAIPNVTTTTTTTVPPTTTTTTTVALDYYLADRYTCGTCSLQESGVVVSVTAGSTIDVGNYYQEDPISGNLFLIIGSTTGPAAFTILDTDLGSVCGSISC